MVEFINENVFLFIEALIYSVAIVVLLCQNTFKRKIVCLLATYLFYVLLGLGLKLLHIPAVLVAIIDIFILTVFATTIFKAKSSYVAFCIVSIHYLFIITDLLIGTGISFVSQQSLFEMMTSSSFNFTYSLASKSASAILIFICVAFLKRTSLRLPRKFWYSLSIVNIAAAAMVLLMGVYIVPAVDYGSIFYIFIILLCILAINFALFALFASLAKHHYNEELSIIMDETSKRLNAEIQMLNEANASFRKFKHDWANNVNNIAQMLHDDTANTTRKYIDELADTMPTLDSEKFCELASIDAVIKIKRKKCADESIRLDRAILPLFIDSIKQIDIANLMANLLDNAINAELLLPEPRRNIFLGINRSNDMIAIKVTNSIDTAIHDKINVSRPILSEDREHGWGLIIAKDICERYHGSLKIKPGGTIFEVQALLIDAKASP